MNKRKHIALDASVVTNRLTGVGRSVVELVRALSEIESEYKYSLITSSPEHFSFLRDNSFFDIISINNNRASFWNRVINTHRDIPQIAKEIKADLIHFTTIPMAINAPCKSVLTVHDIAFHLFPETVSFRRKLYYKATFNHSLKKSSAIITNSNATAQELCENFIHAVGKVTVTKFGTPSWVDKYAAKPIRQNDAPLLFVGSLEPRKNLTAIIDAYLLFRERENSPKLPVLTIAGARGWLDDPIVSKIEKLKEKGLINWEGYCDSAALSELYNSASALLFPSLHEGFGFPTLEAMSFNLPVITSDCGAMKEVANGAALLVNPENVESIADAIQKLYNDRPLAELLCTKGEIHSRTQSWGTTALQTEKVYRAVLKG